MAHILMLLLLLTVSSAPGSAEQAVAQTLDEKIEDIQRRLQSSYDNQDFRVLLAKKESVDSFFLPVFLLFEMQQLPRLDFCRLYRFEYEPGRLRHGLMDKDDVSLLHPCADLRQINAGQCLKFDLAIERYPYVGPDYPIAVHATAFVAATTVDLYFSWYEPCLANRDLDFPIHPECFHVHWDPNEYCLWCKITNEAPARESATTSFPLFNNPAMLYTVFDSLRLQKTLLHDSSYDSLARAPTADGTICLSTDDNRPLRRTRLYRNDEGLPAATIEQYPLILHHQSDTAFQIQRDIGGTTDKVLDFLPRADLNYLGRGRTIDITWYHAASLGDVLFPKTLTVSCRGRELSRINFGPVELVARAAAQGYDGERVSSPEITRMKGLYEQIARKVPIDNPTYYTESELTGDRDGLTLRRRIKYNALAAAYRGDYAVLDYTCRRYRQLFGKGGWGGQIRIQCGGPDAVCL